MTTMTLLPQSRPLTVADLETIPDDGHRYELIDGALIVTPSPSLPHQRAAGRLFSALVQAATVQFEVMFAPLDVTISDVTVLQPDILVAPRSGLTGRKLVGLPVLAVEALSPSTRLIDINLKKAAFEQAGVASFWVVDTDAVTITAWELDDGRYVEAAAGSAGEPMVVAIPFPLTVDPADLVL